MSECSMIENRITSDSLSVPSPSLHDRFEVHGRTLGGVSIRTLGPALAWGAEIVSSTLDRVSVTRAIQEVSQRMDVPIAGYFVGEGSETRFHLSRVPRRVGEALRPVADFENVASALAANLFLQDPQIRLIPEQASPAPEYRAIFGLQEGYDESGGSKIHTIVELRALLGEDFKITAADIFSARPQQGTYQEPAAIIECAKIDANLEKLCVSAQALKQPRFTLEALDTRDATNVEVLMYALTPSAQSRVTFPEPQPDPNLREELRAILCGEELPSKVLEKCYLDGKLDSLYELVRLRGIPQNPEWHPEGDAWVHSLMVVDKAWESEAGRALDPERRFQLLLGALCHDVGKALVTQWGSKGWKAWEHEKAGVEPARTLLTRLAADDHLRDAVLEIVENHMTPPRLFREYRRDIMDERQFVAAVKRQIARLGTVSPEVFILACEADSRGRGTPEANESIQQWLECFRIAAKSTLLEEVVNTKGPSLITGKDLLGMGMKAGPEMGALLKDVSFQFQGRSDVTREEALTWARQRLAAESA